MTVNNFNNNGLFGGTAPTERKSFGAALFFFIFGGLIGAHFVYVTERAHYLLWFWIVSLVSFGIIPLITAFFIKRMVVDANAMYDIVERNRAKGSE